jgi:hypothetical protein
MYAMEYTDSEIHGISRTDSLNFSVDSHISFARNYEPMFRALLVALI